MHRTPLRFPAPRLTPEREQAINDLNNRVDIIHDYWLDTFGEMPDGIEASVIVCVLAAFDRHIARQKESAHVRPA